MILFLALLADNVDHDNPKVLHFFEAVGQFAFILLFHLFELVFQSAILDLLAIRILLLRLQLLIGYLALGFEHLSSGLRSVSLDGELAVLDLRLRQLLPELLNRHL